MKPHEYAIKPAPKISNQLPIHTLETKVEHSKQVKKKLNKSTTHCKSKRDLGLDFLELKHHKPKKHKKKVHVYKPTEKPSK